MRRELFGWFLGAAMAAVLAPAPAVGRDVRDGGAEPSTQFRTPWGDPDLRTPVHWDEWSDKPSPRTSIIVDPPNGRIPPLTLGAQSRPPDPAAVIGFAGGSFGDGPFNGPDDYNPIDRCITRGPKTGRRRNSSADARRLSGVYGQPSTGRVGPAMSVAAVRDREAAVRTH